MAACDAHTQSTADAYRAGGHTLICTLGNSSRGNHGRRAGASTGDSTLARRSLQAQGGSAMLPQMLDWMVDRCLTRALHARTAEGAAAWAALADYYRAMLEALMDETPPPALALTLAEVA
jgi:hypothetical protein